MRRGTRPSSARAGRVFSALAQAPAGYLMEDRYAMTVARAGPKPKRQVPPGDVCTECGRMTCEACGAEIPAHRVRAHREGRDGARPQCPLQDIRAMALERERPRSFANRLFGTVAA